MKNCIFISAGDKERFASWAIENLADDFDIIINYYGNNELKLNNFKEKTNTISIKSTKFISLKQIYDKFIKNKYNWVSVFDDDAKFVSGSMQELVYYAERFNLDIISGSHTGKVSHFIHNKLDGNHKIRYVNFIEMNFPVFKNMALEKYMNVYDGKLCGWGNDWWYCKTLGANEKKIAAIVDSVCIENPQTNREMESFMGWEERRNQWENFKNKLNIVEWEKINLGFA